MCEFIYAIYICDEIKMYQIQNDDFEAYIMHAILVEHAPTSLEIIRHARSYMTLRGWSSTDLLRTKKPNINWRLGNFIHTKPSLI